MFVQYEAEVSGIWTPVIRYDMAHGYLHRDILLPGGRREKLPIPYTSLGDALVDALEFIESQWEFYRRIYDAEIR